MPCLSTDQQNNHIYGLNIDIYQNRLYIYGLSFERGNITRDANNIEHQINEAIASLIRRGYNVDHILMSATLFGRMFEAGMVSSENIGKFSIELVELWNTPHHGFQNVNHIVTPVQFRPATLMVHVVPDEQYNMVNDNGLPFMVKAQSRTIR